MATGGRRLIRLLFVGHGEREQDVARSFQINWFGLDRELERQVIVLLSGDAVVSSGRNAF